MEPTGERLRRAIGRQFGSIRKFEGRLKKAYPDLRGTSRQTLYRYFNGEAEPDTGLLKAAASVLGIREEWLINREGRMTLEDEERAQRARASVADAAKDRATWEDFDRFAEWVQEEFPDPRVKELFTHVAIMGTWMLLSEAGLRPRWCVAGEDRPEWDARNLGAIRVPPEIEEEHREDYAMATYVGRILATPFLYLPIPGPSSLSDAQLIGYVGTVCQGLQRLADTGINRKAGVGTGIKPNDDTPSEQEATTTKEEENHA